ncbi:GlxA family transcriptional regulator [Nocardia jinanensis]|uniref:Transcriptional regulator, AraC family protein n=1 Tax=Nocardia jinanensis TaxID=382504 RepID=A0A917VKU4_9NOCA|nr:GlxA family transcriptional regulator [Nocardia jinanensis]GGK90834.1 putative transcriptional regulator, AraC family protein [Nocardia jinanensis]
MQQPRVVFVLFDDFQALDFVGPHEVFRGTGHYDCRVVATRARPVRTDSGLLIAAEHRLDEVDPATVDTLVVVGGPGVDAAARDPVLVEWIRSTASHARRVTSVCTGAFLLAAAGVLNGRRVTTHWAFAEQLSQEYPAVIVDSEPIFVRDGQVWSSAGVTSGIDMALALVEEDRGRQVALTIARYLVMFLRRPGGQTQFSTALWRAQPATDPIRAVVSAIHADPGARHSIDDLAARAGLSPRHLQRRFTAELGTAPAAYVEQVRVEAAQRDLLDGDSVEQIARRCGFGTAESLRRAFHRRLGVAPSDYRDRFRSVGTPY